MARASEVCYLVEYDRNIVVALREPNLPIP
jgi:hypothetical protein